MMPTILEERFQMLLTFAKDTSLCSLARENLAAAKEILNTLLSTGHLEMVEYKAYWSLCTTAGIIISTEELQRAAHLPREASHETQATQAEA
ncbi:hypothetical protein D3C73_1375160 [compost metagenome]